MVTKPTEQQAQEPAAPKMTMAERRARKIAALQARQADDLAKANVRALLDEMRAAVRDGAWATLRAEAGSICDICSAQLGAPVEKVEIRRG